MVTIELLVDMNTVRFKTLTLGRCLMQVLYIIGDTPACLVFCLHIPLKYNTILI